MAKPSNYDLLIGIDPGVETGVAIWDQKKKHFRSVCSVQRVRAEQTAMVGIGTGIRVLVVFEDARLRRWFGNSGPERWKGAGSIMRDCQLWEEFCQYHNIDFIKVAPKNNRTKLSSREFQRITGYEGRTNEHGRDAAMLVFGR